MTSGPQPYGERRGISASDVSHAADTLLRAGTRPTVERLRAALGRGSPNTLGPLLDAWWSTLAARLDAGPAALHRLPESVAHICEALWMQALDDGRRHAAQELANAGHKLATERQSLEIRSHVLTLREGEMEARLRDRERESAAMLAQLQGLTGILRQTQLTGEAQTRRIAELEAEVIKAREQLASLTLGPPNRPRPAAAKRSNRRKLPKSSPGRAPAPSPRASLRNPRKTPRASPAVAKRQPKARNARKLKRKVRR